MANTRTRVPLSPFGARIMPLLEQSSITAAALAEQVGIHPVTLWRWMRQSSSPRGDQLVQMAKALGVDVSALTSEAPTPKKSRRKPPA